MRRAHELLHVLREPLDLLGGDDARFDEPLRELLRTVGWFSIRSAISGCVYAGSSPSLWPCRR